MCQCELQQGCKVRTQCPHGTPPHGIRTMSRRRIRSTVLQVTLGRASSGEAGDALVGPTAALSHNCADSRSRLFLHAQLHFSTYWHWSKTDCAHTLNGALQLTSKTFAPNAYVCTKSRPFCLSRLHQTSMKRISHLEKQLDKR